MPYKARFKNNLENPKNLVNEKRLNHKVHVNNDSRTTRDIDKGHVEDINEEPTTHESIEKANSGRSTNDLRRPQGMQQRYSTGGCSG